MNPRTRWSQPPAGWGQPHLPGWAPLVDHGPLGLQTARTVGRWWWPTLTVAGFLAIVVQVLGDPADGPTGAGLLTIALAAAVVVLLTIHLRHGPAPLARAVTEYTVVALLATLLAAPAIAVDHQANHTGRADAQTEAAAGDDRPGLLRAGAALVRAVTTAARAVAGAVGWLVDKWHQAGQQTDRPSGSPSTTTPTGEAMPRSPALASTSTRRPL